jgi:hypothetical protein
MTIPELAAHLQKLAAKAKAEDRAALLEAADVLMKARLAQAVPHMHGQIKLRCPLCEVPIVTKG